LLPTQPAERGAPAADYQQPPNYGQGYGQHPYQAPYQSPASHADLKPNIAGMLCYPLSFITGLIFLVLTPYNKDSFVRFHAWQSIFFFVALAISSVVLRVVLPWPIEGVFLTLLNLLALGGTGYSMFKAYNGERFKLPLIGDLAENQASKNPV
jgi:uncharacterized membrane protein